MKTKVLTQIILTILFYYLSYFNAKIEKVCQAQFFSVTKIENVDNSFTPFCTFNRTVRKIFLTASISRKIDQFF